MAEKQTWARAAEGVGRGEVGGRQASLLVTAAKQLLQVCCRAQIHAELNLAQHQLKRVPCRSNDTSAQDTSAQI